MAACEAWSLWLPDGACVRVCVRTGTQDEVIVVPRADPSCQDQDPLPWERDGMRHTSLELTLENTTQMTVLQNFSTSGQNYCSRCLIERARLLQSQKLQQELTAPPTTEQAPPMQPSPEERSRGDEPIKRNASVAIPVPGDATVAASAAPANGKPGKDNLKPSPSKTYAVSQNPSL